MRVLIAIGTTGGHIYPGMVIADKLLEKGHAVQVITRKGGIAEEILRDKHYDLRSIACEGLKRKLSLSLFRFMFKFKLSHISPPF